MKDDEAADLRVLIIEVTSAMRRRLEFLTKMAWLWAFLVLVMVGLDLCAAYRTVRATRLDRQATEMFVHASQALVEANELKMSADVARRALLGDATKEPRPLVPPAEAFVPFESK
jgi:hypothetical protein